jgi:hypothetical protein
MMEALRSSERSVLIRATERNIPEDDVYLREYKIVREDQEIMPFEL